MGDWFQEVAADAHDLNAEIAHVLEGYLELASPFDAYLLALRELFKAVALRREEGAHVPVYYQQQVAAWATRQLAESGGALLVVATGLGKTVIGAEIAGLLHAAGDVGRVVLLAPHVVHDAWRDQIGGRAVPVDAFDNSVLFAKGSRKRHHQVARLTTLLSRADARTLIVVVEAHAYKNQLLALTGRDGSRAAERMTRATRQGARVVLLTGSAYGTSVQNLNSLLLLLPHRAPGLLDDGAPWHADSYGSFVSLPPVAVLGYPHVIQMARERGDIEDGQPYVDFRDERKYLPTRLQTLIVPFSLLGEADVAAAFEARCFDQSRRAVTRTYRDGEGIVDAVTDTVFNATLDSWLSSPRALLDCLASHALTEGSPDETALPEFDGDTAEEDGAGKTRGQNATPTDLFGNETAAPVSPRRSRADPPSAA